MRAAARIAFTKRASPPVRQRVFPGSARWYRYARLSFERIYPKVAGEANRYIQRRMNRAARSID